MTNCKNCGAPIQGSGKCEYCGTVNGDRFIVPASGPLIYLDGKKIGKFIVPEELSRIRIIGGKQICES